jgi:hypothetical protein
VSLAPGPEQGPKGWESKRHLKLEPRSEEAKEKPGFASSVASAGLEVIVVCGGVASTVKLLASSLRFPAASAARTRKV